MTEKQEAKLDKGPRWVPCPDCGEWFCLLHNEHAGECECPPIEELDFDPYTTWGPEDAV